MFGVADGDTLVGLANAKADAEKMSEVIKVKMDPIPEINLQIRTEDGKQFVVLQVRPGNETLYYYVGEGNMTAYVRIGNESVPANAIALRGLVLRESGKHYDALPSHYAVDDSHLRSCVLSTVCEQAKNWKSLISSRSDWQTRQVS